MGLLRQFLGNAHDLTFGKAFNSPQINQTEVDIARVGSTSDYDPNDKQAIYPQWFFSSRLGQPRQIDFVTLRNLAQSAWVQMVLNTFKKEISTIEWRIVPVDEEDETDYTEDIKKCEEFFANVNKNRQTVEDINSEVITDIGELDAGVWNYVFSTDSYTIGEIPVYDAWGQENGEYERGLILKPLGQRTLVQIKSVDGASVLKQVDIHKNLLRYYQYSFKHPRKNPTPFELDEIEYLLMNAKSYTIYGFSPVQSIQQELQVLIQGTRYNKDLYKNNAIPDLLISIPKLANELLKKIKRKWKNQYEGKPHQIGFINWPVDGVHKLAESNRDLEWLNGQQWYFKIVFAAFGVSPTEAGFFENANKSNDEGQARVTVRNAIKPYLQMLANVHTRKSIPEILQKENPGLMFKFFPKDHTEEKIEHEQHKWEVENGVLTINDYRKIQGKEPYEWGDEPFKKPGQETSFNFGTNPMNPEQPDKDKEKDKKDMDKEKDKFNKYLELEAGDDIVNEAKDYSDFLLKLFDSFEKRVLAAADDLNLEKSYTRKFFGDFMKNLFNTVNTVTFAKHVKRFLKADLMEGLVSAEDELGIDIGFTEKFEVKLNLLQQQQLNGYTINGKKWFGIKGVTKDLQSKITATVQSGVTENKSITDIKENIKKDFGGFSDWRANMIARTETNKTINSGKLLGYKESGMKGKKVWKAAMDNRTSDVCRRLNNQIRELDEDFQDPETLKTYPHPPSLPNCRSVILFLAD